MIASAIQVAAAILAGLLIDSIMSVGGADDYARGLVTGAVMAGVIRMVGLSLDRVRR